MNLFVLQSAPEKSHKDIPKSSNNVQSSAAIGGKNKVKEEVVKKNSSELTNGYAKPNNHIDVIPDNKLDRGRQRTKKDEKINSELFHQQMAKTMQNLQRDLDSITTRVRSLEAQALQVFASQSVRT